MNVLFCNFDEEWHDKVIGTVSKEIGAKRVVSMSVKNHDLSPYVADTCWIDSRDINNKRYTYMEGKDLPGLDADILNQLRWCEALYYPMLDRMEVENLKSISYHQRKRYYENDLRIMLWIVKHYEIDLCVFSTIPHISFDYALYGVCKYLNIPIVISYFGPPIPHRSVTTYYMSEIFDHMPQLRDFKPAGIPEEQIQLSHRMQQYYAHYARERDQIKSFVFFSDYIKPKSSKVKIMMDLVKKKLEQGNLVVSVRKKLAQRRSAKRVDRYLSERSTDKVEGKFIYYPLHYQPECTSLPMGSAYYDQLHVIRLISQNLPDDVTLCVKPHPNRNLLTDVPFYKEILSMRNVKLLKPKTNTYELMDNALAVVSLTGTAILESLVRGTPVMMFGYYIWQYAPNVFHCVSNDDCKKALEQLCAGYTYDRAAFKEFLCELDKNMVDGTLYSVCLDLYDIALDKNINNVTEAMVSYIQKVMTKKNAQ